MSDIRAGFVRRLRLSRLTLIALTAAVIALTVLAPRAAVNLSFASRLVDAGTQQLGLEIGDFNEDGFPDVFSADNSGVTLMLNRTDNWFFAAPGFPMALPNNPTDPTLVAGETVIKAQHLIDLRVAVSEAYQASSRPPQPFTDPTITVAQSMISAVHIAELRFIIRMLEES
jgi:hypothetical protein